MTTEKIKDFISKTDLSQIQKNVMCGFIDRAKDKQEFERENRRLIEQVSLSHNVSEVILSTDEVKIYTVRGKDDWDIKYPFRSIFIKDGKWQRSNTVSPSLDVAFLVYLEGKYLGYNSRFNDFAIKMLEIKID